MPKPQYRPGDRVTLSISPPIKLAPYEYAKPFASVSREMTGDPKQDAVLIEEMEGILQHAIRRAAAIEINMWSDFADAVENGPGALIDFCIRDVGAERGTERQSPSGGKPAVKTPGQRSRRRRSSS